MLLADATRDLVAELVGDQDRSLVVDELSGDDYEAAAIVAAAQTPPFLADRRVVVAHHAGRFSSAASVAPIVDYLEAPLPTSAVVLVWEKGFQQQRLSAPPKTLAKVVGDTGGAVIDTNAPSGRGRTSWIVEQISRRGLAIDASGAGLIAEHLGEDVSRLRALLELLSSTYGDDARIGADDIAPFLGDEGSVPPWELTDAIDAGDIGGALERLARMMGPGGRHPLQLMATLQGHVGRLLRSDGAPAGAAGSSYPAKKAAAQAHRLGSEKIQRAVALMATADVDLRGRSAWPPELVMEVLVARLANLSR